MKLPDRVTLTREKYDELKKSSNTLNVGRCAIDRAIVERLEKLINTMDIHGDVAKVWVKDVLLRVVRGA